jgi:uncharacterized protein (DUF58 family)
MASPLLLDRDFLRTLEEMTLLCRKDLSGTIGSDHSSRNHGPGLEFADYRRYSFGDDPRFLDWSAYLRLGKLFLKIYQTEEHIPVRVLIDTSRSMDCQPESGEPESGKPAGGPKFRYALRLAATFAYLALLRLDTAVVIPFAESIRKPLVAAGGRERFWPVMEFLNGLGCGGRTDLLASVKQFLRQFTGKGVAVILSDFFDEEGAKRAVEMLRFAGHDFVLLHVHTPDEQRPASYGELILEDAETGERRRVHSSPEAAAAYERAFLEYCGRLERLAARNGGRYGRALTSVPYQDFVLRGLRGGRVVE